MNLFFQASAIALIISVLGLTLVKMGKEFTVLLTIAGCCMVVVLCVSFLEPVLDLVCRLQSLGNLNGEMVQILFKVVGIGLVSEIVGLVCSDAGNGSLGKALQMLGTAVILWLSIPVFQALLDLIQDILGDL